MSFEEENKALLERVAAIKAKYEPQLTALAEKGKKISDDFKRPGDIGAVVGIDFKVDWKDVELSFDVPSITIEDKSVSVDLPEIFSARQNISFDVPDVRMVDRKVGQYPEIDGFTVRWKDIIVTVPEPYMRRVEMSYDLPSVTMKRQDFVIGIPKITMETVKWVIGLPQFTVINVNVQIQDLKDKGNALQQEGSNLAQQMKQEIEAEVAKFKGMLIAGAFAAKTGVSNQFNNALGTVKTAIEDLQRQGCDPIKVPTPQGDVNLRKIYDDLDANKSRSLSEFDQIGGVVS